MSLKDLTDKLDQFLESKYLNLWLKQAEPETMEIYVRRSIRRVSGLRVTALDIANFGPRVNVQQVMKFTEYAESIKGKYDIVFFENLDIRPLIGDLILRRYQVYESQYVQVHGVNLYKILPDHNLPS